MRRALIHTPGPIEGEPLRVEQAAEPEPGDGEVLLSVAACGVCRTDLQLAEGDIPPRKRPVVPGHQIVGRVLSLGRNATGVKVGERVGVGWLGFACGACRHCRAGRENLCATARFTGWDVDGGYATHAIARADFVFPLPEGWSDLSVAPLLCGGVIGYRALRRSRIEPGGVLGLYGFGASALLAIQVARHWGCRVFVCTRSRAEQERARALGAEWAGGYEDRPPEALDAAVTFAPSGDVVIAALRATAPGGTVAINAIHLDRVPQFSYDDLWLERNLVSVANYTREDAREFLALAERIPVETRTQVVSLEGANEALAKLRRGEVDGTFVVRP
ncbi:MAG TPA: zinc-dependent alcohol dehydrogenase family protein [Polyangiaceae bacterium]|nr:zinc-dependent alcohol dehydrogenase family protein [Polyangiaceae bacterium]